MVVAPASITASMIRHRKSVSERPASSGENSTLSVKRLATFTESTACASTSSGCIRSFIFIWMGEVAIKVWIRDEAAGFKASPARTISFSSARARPHTVLSLITEATAFTDSKSPGLATGKPASIISTCIFSSALAIRTFSSFVMEAPGLCSPSRKVVSNIINWSCTVDSLLMTWPSNQ